MTARTRFKRAREKARFAFGPATQQGSYVSIDRMLGTGNSTAPPATGSPGDEQGWWTNPKAQVRRAPSLLPAPPNTNFKFAKKTCLMRPFLLVRRTSPSTFWPDATRS